MTRQIDNGDSAFIFNIIHDHVYTRKDQLVSESDTQYMRVVILIAKK